MLCRFAVEFAVFLPVELPLKTFGNHLNFQFFAVNFAGGGYS